MNGKTDGGRFGGVLLAPSVATLGKVFRPRLRPRKVAPISGPTTVQGMMVRGFRTVALSALALVITAASGASFAESYRGLFVWALNHGLSGFWAAAFPLQVDAFIVVGELSLFIAMTDRWRWRDRAGAWAVALLGLTASVAGNIGHVIGGDIQTRGTAAVPPLAAFAALWVGLGVLKRTLARRDQTGRTETLSGDVNGQSGNGGTVPPDVPKDAEHAALLALRATNAVGNPLSGRQLETRFGLTRAQATKLRRMVSVETSDQTDTEPVVSLAS